MMIVRAAQAADVPAMLAMATRFQQETGYVDHMTWPVSVLERLWASLIVNPDALVLVLESAAIPVGMLGALIFTHPMSGERTCSELFWWVNPEARGGGLKLMREAERWAREHGAVRMLMIAPTPDVGRLYARRGYREVETSYQRSLA